MSRYVERQLNHQRHLLSLELPVMMQNRSEGLNERLKRILGMDDTQEASVEWSRGNRSDDGEDNDELEGSAGDLASRPYSKFETNAHIEVVDALPSPACDSVNFAVILHLPLFSLSLSLSHFWTLTYYRLHCTHTKFLFTINVHHVVVE